MFLPDVHAETDQLALQQFIRENPLGILITGIQPPQQDQNFLQCTHVPFVLDAVDSPEDENKDEKEPSLRLRLRAHIAKQNPQVKAIIEAAEPNTDNDNNEPPQSQNSRIELPREVLVLFNGKHDHYVTPKYYTLTKPATGKVVPTWNYTAVQAYGKLSLYYDSRTPDAGSFLDKQIRDLSGMTEREIMGYTGTGEEGDDDDDDEKPGPWKVDDAPGAYIELLKRNIVGIEISVTKVQGKFKMSQEMRAGDREGVVKGFAELGGDVGKNISALVKERGELHDLKKQEKKQEAGLE